MNIKRAQLMRLCVLMIFLQVVTAPNFASAHNDETIYHELAKLEQSELETIYVNTSLPGFNTYSNAINLMTEYPMYSYTLFSECRKLVIENNTKKFITNYEEANAIELMMSNIEIKMTQISKKIVVTKPKTIASSEWLSLAKVNFEMAEDSFAKANEQMNSDFNTTISLLINTQYYLHKTENLLVLAEMRNDLKNDVDPNKIVFAEKDVASTWIELASLKTDSTDKLLKKTQSYYDEDNFYFSLMLAADVNTSRNIVDDKEDKIVTAKQHIHEVELAMASVYNDSNIDVPTAQLKIELSKLHLNDAEKDNSIASSLIAYNSIQEAIVAKEQIDAVLAVKDKIEKADEIESTTNVESIPCGISPLIGVLIIYLLLRRKS